MVRIVLRRLPIEFDSFHEDQNLEFGFSEKYVKSDLFD